MQTKNKIPKRVAQKRIYFGVLDWGLGHATRSSPIIDALLAQGCEVQVFGNGLSGQWLQRRFPQCTFHELPGPQISYPSRGNRFWWSMAQQAPALSRWIRRDEAFLASLPRPDATISDHRPGFKIRNVPSVLVAHQLSLPFPSVLKPFQLIYHRLMGGFTHYWIPDLPQEQLSAKLSKGPFPADCIGYLSACKPIATDSLGPPLWLMSGPEPQRSIWEAEGLKQLAPHMPKLRWVRGTNRPKPKRIPEGWEVVDLALPQDLNPWLQEAPWVWCRSGYSSLMDLRTLGKRAFLKPTPGQAEQELLARWHHGQFGWLCQDPNPALLGSCPNPAIGSETLLNQALQNLLNSI